MTLPTIDDALGIEVTEEKGGMRFRADPRKLPGTPVKGLGRTPEEAKYDLLAKLMWEMTRLRGSPDVIGLLRVALYENDQPETRSPK